jgi:hypothetical protein
MHGLTADHPGMSPHVRFAGLCDEEGLIAMVRELHTESGLRDGSDRPLPLNEAKVRATVRRAILPRRRDPDGDAGHAAIGVIGSVGQIEGSVYLSVETTWYSEAPFLTEIWNYVPLPYRRSENAKTLIAFSKAVASTLGLPLVMGVMSTERQPAKLRFYERNLGCRPLGAFYLWNPTTDGTA